MPFHDPNMTEIERAKALVAYMQAENERTAKRVARHIMRRATVGFCILAAGIAGAFWVNNHDEGKARDAIIKSGSVVAVDSCNARYNDRQSLRQLFVRLQIAVDQQAKNEGIPLNSPRVRFAKQFYKDQLQRLPLPDCRPTAHILTDQPFPPVHIPRPKHP